MRVFGFFILAILFSSFTSLLSAQTEQNTEDPTKATLYIVRTSGLGAAINFKYFINDQFVGKCNYGKYLKLEVEPGEHLIWAKAENRSFIEANLEAGKVYVLNALPKMGAFKAGVRLQPIDTQNERELKIVKKYIVKKKLLTVMEYQQEMEQVKWASLIDKSVAHYHENLKNQKETAQLNMPINLDAIDISKKKKKK